MARIFRNLLELCWGLGFLSLLAAVVLKAAPHLGDKWVLTARGGLIFAGVLFLGALATAEMARATSAAK